MRNQDYSKELLEHYDDLKDIKRVIVHTNVLPSDWLVSYFGQLNVDQSVACIKELLSNNMQQNLQVVIQVATKYSDLIGAAKLIKILKSTSVLKDCTII